MAPQLSTDPASVPPAALRIGAVVVDPPLLQAPMAKFTNYAFRQVLRRFGGVGLTATEMVSARSFLAIDARSDTFPERLWGVLDEPRPLAVQIWDNDPAALAEVGIAWRRSRGRAWSTSTLPPGAGACRANAESGSYLLRYPDRVGEIVRRVAAACHPTPVTAKIRLGPSESQITACEVAEAVESAGGAAVTVHRPNLALDVPRPGRLGSNRPRQGALEESPGQRTCAPPKRSSRRFGAGLSTE